MNWNSFHITTCAAGAISIQLLGSAQLALADNFLWLQQEVKKCKCPFIRLGVSGLSQVYKLSWITCYFVTKSEPRILRLVVHV